MLALGLSTVLFDTHKPKAVKKRLQLKTWALSIISKDCWGMLLIATQLNRKAVKTLPSSFGTVPSQLRLVLPLKGMWGEAILFGTWLLHITTL